jgi:hypothetical protein
MSMPVTESASDSIDDDERLRLYVRSGGRCAFCNTHLMEHEFTAVNVHTGEMAHIVGRAKTEKSPRGMNKLPIEQRNLAENLMLACPNDHTMIDKKTGQEIWTVDDLVELKRRHEDRIHYLTGLGEDAETVVVRAIGAIHGSSVEVGTATVRGAVHDAHRYPRYELGVRSESDIEIDLRTLPGEGSDDYWDTVRQYIERASRQIAAGVEGGHVRHLSVFAIARIPLLVLLGHHLDDKIPTDLYEKHRDGLGWRWARDEEPVAFEFVHVAGDDGAQDVTLVCSISGSVSLGELPDELAGTTVYELRPVGTTPVTDLIRVPETLIAFSATYRAFLASIEKTHPDAAVVNVLGALPITAAVEIGRRRTRHVHPPLRVWDRADGGYALAVEVGP